MNRWEIFYCHLWIFIFVFQGTGTTCICIISCQCPYSSHCPGNYVDLLWNLILWFTMLVTCFRYRTLFYRQKSLLILTIQNPTSNKFSESTEWMKIKQNVVDTWTKYNCAVTLLSESAIQSHYATWLAS